MPTARDRHGPACRRQPNTGLGRWPMQEMASSRWPRDGGTTLARARRPARSRPGGSRMKVCQHAGMCSPTAVLSAPCMRARLIRQRRGWSEDSTAVATSSELRSHPGCNVLGTRSHRTAASQHFSWSAYGWSPPPESNRRPHPYMDRPPSAVLTRVVAGHWRPWMAKLLKGTEVAGYSSPV